LLEQGILPKDNAMKLWRDELVRSIAEGTVDDEDVSNWGF